MKGYGKLISGILVLWFAASIIASGKHLLATDAAQPPLLLLIFAVAPVVLFVIALSASAGFRGFITSLDPRTITFLQAWRVIGFAALPLATYGILPSSFGSPAGWGDVAIGLTAPLVALRLANPRYRSAFLVWQALGIADLLIAAGLGVAGRNGTPPTSPLSQLPLSILPTFLVPCFLILHIICMAQAWSWSAERKPNVQTRVQSSLA